MKVLDVSDLPGQKYEEIKDKAWWHALQNSIRDIMQRNPNIDKDDLEKLFEKENNCKIHYAYEGKKPTVIIFPEERDWTMFILRWA